MEHKGGVLQLYCGGADLGRESISTRGGAEPYKLAECEFSLLHDWYLLLVHHTVRLYCFSLSLSTSIL